MRLFLLNPDGGTTDSWKGNSLLLRTPPAPLVLKLYNKPGSVGWLGYIEADNEGVRYWITLDRECLPASQFRTRDDIPGIAVEDESASLPIEGEIGKGGDGGRVATGSGML